MSGMCGGVDVRERGQVGKKISHLQQEHYTS